MINFYKVLNVTDTASADEIKKAFKKEIFQSHPDKLRNQNKYTAAEINHAYDILKDEEKRALYDIKLAQEHKSLIPDLLKKMDDYLVKSHQTYQFDFINIFLALKIELIFINSLLPPLLKKEPMRNSHFSNHSKNNVNQYYFELDEIQRNPKQITMANNKSLILNSEEPQINPWIEIDLASDLTKILIYLCLILIGIIGTLTCSNFRKTENSAQTLSDEPKHINSKSKEIVVSDTDEKENIKQQTISSFRTINKQFTDLCNRIDKKIEEYEQFEPGLINKHLSKASCCVC